MPYAIRTAVEHQLERMPVATLITPHEVKAIDRARCPHTMVHSAMIPRDRVMQFLITRAELEM